MGRQPVNVRVGCRAMAWASCPWRAAKTASVEVLRAIRPRRIHHEGHEDHEEPEPTAAQEGLANLIDNETCLLPVIGT